MKSRLVTAGISGAALGLVLCASPSRAQAQAADDRPVAINVGEMPTAVRQIYSYLLTIEQYTHVARDPAATGIAAVMSASELLKPQGAEAAIAFFASTLQRTDNEAVRRAIRMQLIDLYKQNNQQDKALEELKAIIIEAPRD